MNECIKCVIIQGIFIASRISFLNGDFVVQDGRKFWQNVDECKRAEGVTLIVHEITPKSMSDCYFRMCCGSTSESVRPPHQWSRKQQ